MIVTVSINIVNRICKRMRRHPLSRQKDFPPNLRLGRRQTNDNLFIGTLGIFVQLGEAVHSKFDMRFAVMFNRFRPIVVFGHIRGCDDEILLFVGESMRAHVFLVLFEQHRSSRNQKARIVGIDHNRGTLPLELGLLFRLEQINVPKYKSCLTVAFENIIQARSKNAGAAGK